MLPLSLVPDLRRLGPVSIVSVLSCVTITLTMVTLVLHIALGGQPASVPVTLLEGVEQAASLSSHVLPADGVMQGLVKGLPILSLALGLSLVLSLGAIFGIGGTAVFGGATQDNILMNFEATSALSVVLKVVVSVMVTCAYPLVCHCARDSLVGLTTVSNARLPLLRTLVALCMYCLALGTAIVTPSISVVLVISSGSFGTVLFFFVPAYIALRFESPDLHMDEAVEDRIERGKERLVEIEEKMQALGEAIGCTQAEQAEGLTELLEVMAVEACGEPQELEAIGRERGLSLLERRSIFAAEAEVALIEDRQKARGQSILAATASIVTGQRDYKNVRTASVVARETVEALKSRGRAFSLSLARSFSNLSPAHTDDPEVLARRQAAQERRRERVAKRARAQSRVRSMSLGEVDKAKGKAKAKAMGERERERERDRTEPVTAVPLTEEEEADRQAAKAQRRKERAAGIRRLRSSSLAVPSYSSLAVPSYRQKQKARVFEYTQKQEARVLEMGDAVEVDVETERVAAVERERERRISEREEMELAWCLGENVPVPAALGSLATLADREGEQGEQQGTLMGMSEMVWV
ncbi:LOW QUALITY PROTEIN: hypothetical protein KIPB_005789 [Kipferlia bialata]|uniref:Amino acid transporter transmembrane domain-containing protein n=1 Tax=Kipferlia bialata TaxID=797122 RepID=A0A9K3CXQ5_9EUKA|nr:LOW QUALITY PROTEIN: hypothetical protein KIPB_005789 [Kipferlia bialata]